MISWYPSLFVDDVVSKKEKKWKRKVEKGKVTYDLYCIALPSNKENLYDIIGVNELMFQHYKKNHIYIVGLAKGYDNAVDVLIQIVNHVYENTQDFSSKKYFRESVFR